MNRGVCTWPGRPRDARSHYLESWLLPTLGLRASVFHWNPGYDLDQDFYLDVCDVTMDDRGVWQTEDHYIDLVVHAGQRTELVDVDELLEAHHMGLVSPETAERAIHSAVAAIDGLAAHDHDLQAWLGSNGMASSWR